MTRGPSRRRGYALVLVMIFVVLFTAILGVAWRRIASALRVEHVSEVRRQCDKGTIQVLAQAMKVLETRVSVDSGGVAKLNGSTDSPQSFGKSDGLNNKYYRITFTRTADYNPTTRVADWSVSVEIVQPEDVLSLTVLPDPL